MSCTSFSTALLLSLSCSMHLMAASRPAQRPGEGHYYSLLTHSQRRWAQLRRARHCH